jgi:hypothetical protein
MAVVASAGSKREAKYICLGYMHHHIGDVRKVIDVVYLAGLAFRESKDNHIAYSNHFKYK